MDICNEGNGYMRIGITGAQSVGKTTLLNALRSEKLFSENNFVICDEVMGYLSMRVGLIQPSASL